MTKNEYKEAEILLAETKEEFAHLLGISIHTHKSYCGGRRMISKPIQRHIDTLTKLQKLQLKIGLLVE